MPLLKSFKQTLTVLIRRISTFAFCCFHVFCWFLCVFFWFYAFLFFPKPSAKSPELPWQPALLRQEVGELQRSNGVASPAGSKRRSGWFKPWRSGAPGVEKKEEKDLRLLWIVMDCRKNGVLLWKRLGTVIYCIWIVSCWLG